jgi:hypothetical protein
LLGQDPAAAALSKSAHCSNKDSSLMNVGPGELMTVVKHPSSLASSSSSSSSIVTQLAQVIYNYLTSNLHTSSTTRLRTFTRYFPAIS